MDSNISRLKRCIFLSITSLLSLCAYLLLSQEEYISDYTILKHWTSQVLCRSSYKLAPNSGDFDSRCFTGLNCTQDNNRLFGYNLLPISLDDVELENPDVTNGGQWRPVNNTSEPLAIIIPFRNRTKHLSVLLRNLIMFLQIQQKAFHIYIIEQAGNTLFNRASLLNIGFLEATKRHNYSCVIFHDVDLIPMRLCNMYQCPDSGARHLAVSHNYHPPKLLYKGFLGGVLALTPDVMRQINGFTNIMYGWGGEDDDTSARLKNAKISVERYSPAFANYIRIHHTRDSTNPRSYRSRKVCYQTSLHYKLDGLHNVNYTVISDVTHQLYTNITVVIPGPTNQNQAMSYFDKRRTAYGKLINLTHTL